MFDSRSLRRKLGNLIPGESARNHLQNVLTVEWDTHKTVLVDVPGARDSTSARSPDVEMEGLGLNSRRDEREGYGRLGDDGDGDDYLDSFNPNMPIHSSHSRSPNGARSTSAASGSYFDRPYQPSRSHSYNSDKRLPDVPPSASPSQRDRAQSQQRYTRDDEALNPFVSADDFAPGVQRNSQFLQPQRPSPQPQRSRTTEEGWHTFSSSGGVSPSAYPSSPSSHSGAVTHAHMRGVKEPTSPSSSRGTRDSAQTNSTSDENPFR